MKFGAGGDSFVMRSASAPWRALNDDTGNRRIGQPGPAQPDVHSLSVRSGPGCPAPRAPRRPIASTDRVARHGRRALFPRRAPMTSTWPDPCVRADHEAAFRPRHPPDHRSARRPRPRRGPGSSLGRSGPYPSGAGQPAPCHQELAREPRREVPGHSPSPPVGGGFRDEALEMSLAHARLGLTATPPRGAPAARLAELVGPTVFELAVGDLAGGFLASFDAITFYLDLGPDERVAYESLSRVFTA